MHELPRMRSSAAGSQEFHRFADVRSVESLRLAVRRELRVHRGQRALAHLIGVSRGTLRKFVEMRSLPTQENLDKIREWAADRADVHAPLGAVALAILAGDLPASFRLSTRDQLVGILAAAYTEAGEALPEWMGEECRSSRVTHHAEAP
jgi:transcriptional regulator with XRE-family HTH domain